jgi:hypothetical protein
MTLDSAGFKAGFPAAMSEARWQPWRLVTVFAILVFGLWTSLRYSFGAWGPDADIATQVVLWQGVRRFGLAFITSWSFTPDNWLFSLSPIVALVYTIFGTTPQVVVGVGWLIFAASVAMTACLVQLIAGWRAAFAVATMLLFSNSASHGATGFLSYPVSHNISMAWALLALLVAYRAVVHASVISAVLAGVCVFINAVSDPWAGAAIGLPLFLTSLCLAGLNWRDGRGRCAGALCVFTAIALVAARTELFGVLTFLPGASFVITDATGLVGNVGWMFRVLGIMYNIVPFADADFVPAIVIGFLAFAAMLLAAAILAIDGLREASIGAQLVIGVSILSIGGVCVAYLLYQISGPSFYVGRFFVNLRYFGPLLAGIAVARHWENLRIPVRAAIIVYGLLFVASGLASNPGLWTAQAEDPLPMFNKESGTRQLASFLEQNGLSYGYGPYWGSSALAMNWVTKGRVTIRAVNFDPDTGRIEGLHAESSKLFFSPDDQPAGTQQTFLVINNDGENCPSVNDCVAMAINQFGEPSRRLTFGQSVVLVWPHPIVSKIVDY